jgi:hypothetical protein
MTKASVGESKSTIYVDNFNQKSVLPKLSLNKGWGNNTQYVLVGDYLSEGDVNKILFKTAN